MAEVLYGGLLEAGDLNALLASWQTVYVSTGAATLLLAERLPAHVVSVKERQSLLRFEAYTSGIDVTVYTSGRIFQEDFELRWEERSGLFRVIYLGCEQMKSLLRDYKLREEQRFWQLLEEKKLQRNERRYYLFGQLVETDKLEKNPQTPVGTAFAEARIPRPLYYPVSGSPRHVQLLVREYTCQETGRVEYFRFQALLPVGRT